MSPHIIKDEVAFKVLSDARPDDNTMSPFMVSNSRGFLPRVEPIVELPEDFAVLEDILRRMPIKTLDGSPGLLASGILGDTVDKELPDLTDTINKYESDLVLMTALYRDYSFLASAYLLEPCHLRFMKGEPYGLARSKLPRNIAVPLSAVAQQAGFKPWMEYAGSYALYNYRLVDPSRGLEYSNTRLIRAFEHGLDPSSSEAGFVLIHVAMVRDSGALVTAALDALSACSATPPSRATLDAALSRLATTMHRVNATMHRMWTASKPAEYTAFRTFIFGIASQSMFPHGVVYEGVDAGRPQYFRGESGANDSMVPLCDNLLQIAMPDTPLTAILRDFRAYRPGNHRAFLEWVRETAQASGLRDFALREGGSALLYLRALDQVRDFRWRHWAFTREYILKQTKHKTATGGSPIVTWLPNQLQAVLEQMLEAGKHCTDKSAAQDILDLAEIQLKTLKKEVEKYCSDRET